MRARIVAAWLLGLSLGALGTQSGAIAKAALNVPMMTIKIHNNSANFNIYPLISFPGGAAGKPDEWLQGFFGVTWADRNTKKYSTGGNNTRVYVDCCFVGQNGIPPGASVEIKLPLYTPLYPEPIDPTKAKQAIEWWQGINISLYKSPKASGPPDSLRALWDDPNKLQKPLVFSQKGQPDCTKTGPCKLNFFTSNTKDPLGNPIGADPQQLVEATLGANSSNPEASDQNPTAPRWLFNPKVVDYDVSYVNSAYMPVVMEPVGNNRFGWVGAPHSIAAFGNKVKSFLGTPNVGQQWPQYKGSDGKVVPGKIPSALEILALDVGNDPVNDPKFDGHWLDSARSHFLPNPPNSAPIKRLVNAWQSCQRNGDTDAFCININAATNLLLANFDNYVANYKNNLPDWNCNTADFPNPHPIDRAHLTDLQILRHLYGWTPFNEHCGARANLLEKTPGYDKDQPLNYQAVKNKFDLLQYWKDVNEGDYGVFHPYVALIHGPTFLNSPFTYAYSVDDAVGNVLTDGEGIIVAVSGLQNLPNPDHFTPDVHIDFAYKSLSNGNTFDYYGRCNKNPTTPVNPHFSSFSVPVGITQKLTDCVLSLKDNKGRIYLLQVSPQYPPAVCFATKRCINGSWLENSGTISGNPEARIPVQDSCALNVDQTIRNNWCSFRFAFQQHNNDAAGTVEYHVNLGEPIP